MTTCVPLNCIQRSWLHHFLQVPFSPLAIQYNTILQCIWNFSIALEDRFVISSPKQDLKGLHFDTSSALITHARLQVVRMRHLLGNLTKKPKNKYKKQIKCKKKIALERFRGIQRDVFIPETTAFFDSILYSDYISVASWREGPHLWSHLEKSLPVIDQETVRLGLVLAVKGIQSKAFSLKWKINADD